MAEYLKVEKERIKIKVLTVSHLLVGRFIKDKGIRFTDYFNRDKGQDFVVISDVKVYDPHSRDLIEEMDFLALNIHYIVAVTEMKDE
ncbi:MAG: hypothetical protein JW774_05975 [Candidatus Aureabacteria bacterium]|nr:hypothetical protein [Candidatus Auribacterota bacterium]